MSNHQRNTDLDIGYSTARTRRKRPVPRLVKPLKIAGDPRCQEATPEILRIEIDQIFKEFLGNPDQIEYIFPADLNNLQRKYIHTKALDMNIISKSYGKEPDRRLHIKKRKQQLENQAFIIQPCPSTAKYIYEFINASKAGPTYIPPHRRIHRREKVIGKLVTGLPIVPTTSTISKEVLNLRRNLPIYEHKDTIIQTIRNNQVVIVSSETGSGKTTQVAQYIMEDMRYSGKVCKIICTQPRRISTVSAAERVAFERGDALGASVGYHIRLEQKYGVNTNLVYCTTGVFLRNLMIGSEALSNITHIIIDEVHERDKLCDFLLVCLKQTLPQFPKLKIILMSATMNTGKFLDYFGQGKILSIPGRLYPIDTIFLEDILYRTKFMSPKMRSVKLKTVGRKVSEHVSEDVAAAVLKEENLELDEALDDYMNFSESYDYRVHYEEATVQLGMYFLSEGLSVDYQHSRSGRTALMIAAYLGDKEFISRLCNMGANMNLCCNTGKTAFDYAHDRPDTLQLLDYIKSKRYSDENNTNTSEKEAEELLHLYDKTTSDDHIDYDLIVTLISFIHKSNQEGSILVFLPGYDDIMMCNDRIVNSQLACETYQTFFLHGSMNIRDQHEVFKRLPGKRKIILSTNIAETSITIDDVVFVIDTGKAKEKCYDSYNKVSSLQTHWISQACAKQRTGRAGRTRPGMCFRLFSKQRFYNMDEERVPEILRVSLEELCLHTKVIAPDGVNIHSFLTMAPDPPSANSIRVAIENLQFLGALDKEEELTPLGEYLAQLAIEPQLGKMLLYAVVFRCLEPILTLTAAMTHKDPFQLPPQANLRNKAAEKRKELLDGVLSDHLLYLMVFKRWQEETYFNTAHNFCYDYFISHPTMNSILETRSQLLGQLRAAGFVHQANSLEQYNINANSWPLVKAIICTGMYPNIAYPSGQYLATRSEKKVNIQNNSACSNRYISSWLFYDEKIKHRNCLLIRGVTAVTTITVSLMCGIDCIKSTPNSIVIDDWLEFEFPDATPLTLRSSMQTLISRVMANPAYHYSESDHNLVQTVRFVLDAEEHTAELKVPFNVGEKPRYFFPQSHGAVRRGRYNRTNPLRGGFARSVNVTRTRRTVRGRDSDASTSTGGSELTESFSNVSISEDNPSGRLLNGLANGCEADENTNGYQGGHLNSPDVRLLNGLANAQDPGNGWDNGPSNGLSNGHKPGAPNRKGAYYGRAASDKFGDYRDEKIFMLIKPKLTKSVEIGQQTNKWIFAPQTEKKILHYIGKGKVVYLLFTVNHTRAFQGMAEFLGCCHEATGKPTSGINWVHTSELEFNKVRQLRNPYNENRAIFEGLDGQVIEQTVAEELFRIYDEVKHVANLGSANAVQGHSTGAR